MKFNLQQFYKFCAELKIETKEAEWEDKYSAIFYRELLSCARSRDASEKIANWKLEDM